jgi:hypothetical protein
MRKVKGLSKESKRLLVVLCTLLLAASTFLILGVSVWAQPPAQSGGTTQAQNAATIDYWEPQVGTRTVYLTNDISDIHGEYWGPSTLGYFDIHTLYTDPRWPEPHQLLQSQYYHTTGISNMSPVYFDLVGPWYFRMTTPWKLVEEVIGIDQAPDAAQFPQATYAIKFFIIGSGGTRYWGEMYRSNDPTAKTWLEWGMVLHLFVPGKETETKAIVHYRDIANHKAAASRTLASFPMSVGATGTLSQVYLEGTIEGITIGLFSSASGSYTVVAQGKITVPSGTYDTLLIKYDLKSTTGNKSTRIEYTWLAPGIGPVTDIGSLPNEIGPTFKEATDIEVMESQTTVPPQK